MRDFTDHNQIQGMHYYMDWTLNHQTLVVASLRVVTHHLTYHIPWLWVRDFVYHILNLRSLTYYILNLSRLEYHILRSLRSHSLSGLVVIQGQVGLRA